MRSRMPLKICALLLIASLLTLSKPISLDSYPPVLFPPGGGARVGLAQGSEEEDVIFLGNAVDEPPKAVEGTELPGKRTLASKTYQTGPETYRAVISAVPIHYLDETGNWQSIDTTVERQADGNYYSGANLVKAHFPRQYGAGEIEIKIPSSQPSAPSSSRIELISSTGLTAATGSRDVSVSWRPTQLAFSTGGGLGGQRISSVKVAQAQATVSGNSVIYESTFPGVAEEFRVVPGGVKHSLILSSPPDLVPSNPPPDSFLDYEVEMSLTPNINLYVDGVEQQSDFSTSSTIELRLGQEQTVAQLLAPYAYERDNPRETTAGIHAVHFEPDRIIVTVRIPLSWLAAPGRVYPVVIDPTTNAYPMQDTFISSTYATSSFGHWIEMYAGYDAILGYGLEKALMYWNVHPIPANSIINTAQIRLNQFTSQGNPSCSLVFYRLLTPWSSTYATWNQRSFGVPWNSPGASGIGSDYDGTGYGFVFPPGSGWVTTGHHAGFGGWVSNWLADPSSNHGIMLKPFGNPATHDCERGFRTINYGDAPYLEVDYTFTGGTPTTLIHNSAQTHSYPNPDHYYVEDSAGFEGYWRGTALRPLNQSDYDLWLHTSPDFSDWRVGSSYGVGRVDYTLTGKNVTTTGYPRVVRLDGVDQYNIQYMHNLIAPNVISPPSSGTGQIGSNALWMVIELYLSEPGTWQVAVTPLEGNPDLGVAIHDPLTGDYQTRGSALALSDQIGQNLTEQIEFTGSSGVYGLVVWSNVRTGVLQKFRLEVKAPSSKTYLPVVMKNYVPPRGPFGNGGFEDGGRWVLSGELEHLRTTAIKRSGSYSLQLGHDGSDPCFGEVPCSGSGADCESAATAIQGFDVPNSGSPSLSFYYQIYTYDHKPSGDRKADEFSVLIRDLGTGDENLVYLDDLSWVTTYKCYNLSQKATWQSVSSIDLSPYKGKTVELIFKVTNGGHNFWNTWLYVDDVICSGC